MAVPEPETQEAEPVAEPSTETEPVVVPPEPAPPVVTGRTSRVTRKPVRFGNYECYPCNLEQEDTEVTTSPTHPVGKMTLNESIGMEPTLSQPRIPPYQGQVTVKRSRKEIQEMYCSWIHP